MPRPPTPVKRYHEALIQTMRDIGSHQKWFTSPLNLGGVPGSGGGSGIPIGGLIGQLIQSKVAYDTTEASSLYVPPSGQSLLHNLNRIRYWINQKSGPLVVRDEGSPIASGITILDFVGAPVTASESGGVVTIAVSGTGGGGGGETVKVSSDDTVANYLENKLTAASSKISVTTANPGGNEQRQVDLGTVNINDLNDVTITSVGNDEILGYDGGWINRTLVEAGISAVGHTHIESEITDLEHNAIKIQGISVSGVAPSTGEALIYDGTRYVPSGVGPASDTKKVKVSANDTTENYLENKVIAGNNVTITTINEGANEQVQISASGGGAGSPVTVKDEGILLTSGVTSLDFVGNQITATTVGTNVTITVSGTIAEVPSFIGCRTYRTSDWQISSDNGWQTIDWQAENYDTDSFWSSGSTHVMPEDGYYHVIGQVTISGVIPTAERVEVSLFDGSTPIAHMYGGYYASSPGIFTYVTVVDWNFSASDDVNMRILCGDSSQPYVLSGQDKSYLCTHKIEGAYLADFIGCYVKVTDYDNDPPDDTQYAVQFDTSTYEIGGDWWSSGEDTKIVFPEAGYYNIKSHLLWQGLNETPFEISHAIRLNGSTIISKAYDITIDNNGDRTEGNTTLCDLDYHFSKNDYIEVVIWHDRGSTFNDAIRPGDGYSYVAIHKIGG